MHFPFWQVAFVAKLLLVWFQHISLSEKSCRIVALADFCLCSTLFSETLKFWFIVIGSCLCGGGSSRWSGRSGSYGGWARSQQSEVLAEWWWHRGLTEGRRPYSRNREQMQYRAQCFRGCLLWTTSKGVWTKEQEILKTKTKVWMFILF